MKTIELIFTAIMWVGIMFWLYIALRVAGIIPTIKYIETVKMRPKHPTHALRVIDNWDGEGDVSTVLAYEEEGQFFEFDTGTQVIYYDGDKILKTWELK